MPHTGDAPSLAQNKNFRPVLLWILAVVVLTIIVSALYRSFDKKGDEVIQEKKMEVVVYPDRDTEVPLPYYHWFDFGFKEDFQVKLEGIKDPYIFKIGERPPKLGNEIPSSRLYLRSLAGKEIKIKIFLRPKKETEK